MGRTYDPDTGRDWEGTGIVPNIEVPVDLALDEALALAEGRGPSGQRSGRRSERRMGRSVQINLFVENARRFV